jgi:hypothetical protein
MVKSFERRLGLAPKKATEAPFFEWLGVYKRARVPVRNLNLTHLSCPDSSFDCVVALSGSSTCRTSSWPYGRCTASWPQAGAYSSRPTAPRSPTPYEKGVRYFSEAELAKLFRALQRDLPRNRPDFAEENWCYGLGRPVVTVFVEITKPR